MTRIGNIFYLCLLFGALWGAVWTVIITLLALFVSGLTFQPQITAGALAGGVGAAVLGWWPPARRTTGLRALTGLAFIVVLFVSSGGRPMGLYVGTYGFGQIVFVLLMAVVLVVSLHLTAHDMGPGSEKRYNVEVICLRFIKGFGLVMFTIAVALPFFVMVMMSLKNQQLLLSNPLDFSLDFGQGFAALFRSYIELFTQYHFGTYLINSTLVSIATVAITLFFAVPGAYAVARLRFPGQAFLSRSILLIYMVPMIVLVIPLYAIFSQLGLRNTLWGLLFVYPATTIPVALYMLQGYFRGIPAELEEA
ncbi:MAG: carbohydrate ABC transporter permease, partial [Pseudomonadota bacterium]